jgi:hypothetical protein
MSDGSTLSRPRRLGAVAVLAGYLLSAPVVPARAADAGRCAGEPGTLLQRDDPEKPWRVLEPRESVAGQALLLALPGSRAEVDSPNGAVRLTLAGTWPPAAFPPVLESAVRLHPKKKFDLEFTLERGRVLLTNRRSKGPATARVHFGDESWIVTLDGRGDQVALERFGRWLQMPDVKKPRAGDEPDSTVYLIVLKGEADLKADADQHSLRAPPGPALFSWRNTTGSQGPTGMRELPAWAKDRGNGAQGKAARAAVDRLRRGLVSKGVSEALREGLHDQDAQVRSLAVYSLGATDDLSTLLDALENKHHRRTRLAAVNELRHWMGLGKDNPVRLYQALLKKGYTPGQAAIFMELLYGFSERQLTRPETYATLIEYLRHRRLGIRELAHWHLIIKVPDGKDIPYDAAGPDAEVQRAYARWKKLIPDGELPRPAKPKKKR